MDRIRLQVFLSRNGVCSRREALRFVQQGAVKVNGRVVREPSTRVNPRRDKVQFKGKEVMVRAYDYVLLHKPAGYVTTKADRFASKTVLSLLPERFQHLVPVGRLDKDTEGLLLLTNDGDVTYRLTHPKFDVDKLYFLRITGRLSEENRKKLERGLMIEEKKTAPARIKRMRYFKEKTELTITIHEGRKRQIRLMFAAVGHKVTYLKRLAQGPLRLGRLKTGAWRQLTPKEIESITL